MQKILIIVNMVVVILGSALVYYSHFMLKPEPTDQAAEEQALKNSAADKARMELIPIKKLVVNLHSTGTRLRYLSLEINVLTFHADQSQLIRDSEHIFKDVVIQIASQMEPTELDELTGKITFESRVKKAVNTKLGAPVVKQLYFSSFVVQ